MYIHVHTCDTCIYIYIYIYTNGKFLCGSSGSVVFPVPLRPKKMVTSPALRVLSAGKKPWRHGVFGWFHG